VVKIARAGSTVDMGPPHGTKTYDRDAIIIDYFLGTTATLADTGNSERYPGGPQQRRSRPRRPLARRLGTSTLLLPSLPPELLPHRLAHLRPPR
jgi:hypothetical protein